MSANVSFRTHRGGNYYIQKPDDQWLYNNKIWYIVLARRDANGNLVNLCPDPFGALNEKEWQICNLGTQTISNHTDYARLYHFVNPAHPMPFDLKVKVAAANEKPDHLSEIFKFHREKFSQPASQK